ncbi:MAG: hypothetical protein ACYCTB_09825 [bacterium]
MCDSEDEARKKAIYFLNKTIAKTKDMPKSEKEIQRIFKKDYEDHVDIYESQDIRDDELIKMNLVALVDFINSEGDVKYRFVMNEMHF